MKSLASFALLIVLAFGSASSLAQLTPPNVSAKTILPKHTRHVVTALIDVHARVVAAGELSSDEPSLSSTDRAEVDNTAGAANAELDMVREQTQSLSKLHTDPAATIPTFSSHPNPFVGSTSISYSLQRAGQVDVEIYDIRGRRVSHPLADIDRPAGEHTVGLDAAAMTPGVYFCRLTVDGSSRVLRLVHE
jgi:hypothetical protein